MATGDPRADRDLERVRAFVKVMDKFGLDGFLGLFIPEVGDLLGAILGLYVVGLAVQRKTSPLVIARMMMNLAGDAAIGAIPVVGDVADFVFKANEKNLKLLETSGKRGGKSSWKDWLAVVGAGVLLVGALSLTIYAMVTMLHWLFSR
jgi:hypothetical protein